MSNKTVRFLAGLMSTFLVAAGVSLFAQETQPSPQVPPDKILGVWNLEITAESQLFYVNITLQLTEAVLTGAASEPSGYFTDVPLSDLAFDGATLKFGFTSPTPPDGLERALSLELKVVDDRTMDGTLLVPDLNVSATVRAAKQ